jgi:hypothetical protein
MMSGICLLSLGGLELVQRLVPTASRQPHNEVAGFTYLFGLENTWAHRLMVVTLAAVIGLVLFTIGALEYPFSGARIGTGAFDLILERFETSELSNPR